MSSGSSDLHDLYIHARPGLLRRIARRIGCHASASDLVHDVFLRLWERPPGSIDEAVSYLNRSANNAVIDYLRAQRVRHDFAARILPEQIHAPPPSPLAMVEAREEERRIDAAIRALPERTRHVFILNKTHNRSYQEIARALGISRSAVEKHMARAIAACRAPA